MKFGVVCGPYSIGDLPRGNLSNAERNKYIATGAILGAMASITSIGVVRLWMNRSRHSSSLQQQGVNEDGWDRTSPISSPPNTDISTTSQVDSLLSRLFHAK